MRYIDKEIFTAIRDVIELPWMKIENGRKHARLVNKRTGDFIPLAGSSSDRCATKNVKTAARRLAETGHGLIFSRTGR